MRIGFIARPIAEDFEFAALKEFPCVELAFFEDLTAIHRAAEIRGWSQKFGVALSCVSLFGRNYLTEDPEERARCLRELRQTAEFAAAVGARVLTIGAGARPELSLEAQCARAVELLGPEIEAARARGLQVAFYNCRWANFATGPEAWERLLPQLAGRASAGIKFDPSHPLYYGEDWAAHLAAWGHCVLHVHAKDTLFVGGKPVEDVPAGLGEIHWGRFFALLYRHDYTGDISIEPHSDTWTGERLYPGILLARRHLEAFLLPPALATPRDVVPRAG